MEIKVNIQSTPNPNALKFVLNVPAKSGSNCTYTNKEQCGDNALAEAIFSLNDAIREVYFFDNYITVTQNGTLGWNTIKDTIKSTILEKINDHNPDFEGPTGASSQPTASTGNTDLDKINAILDETIRPYLQRDGGDLQVVSYEDKNVTISYQGACGSCPGARMGTLLAIQRILQEKFDPEVMVSMAD